MAKRRGNSEGTITQRENGSWRCQVYKDGIRKSFTGKSQKDCREWRKKIAKEAEAGISISATQQSLQEYLETWLTSIETTIHEGTLYQYRLSCRKYINPALGHLKLADIKPALIQKLMTDRLQDGSGPRTVEMIRAVLHRSLGQAVKLELIGRNPVDATTPPRVETKEMKFYDESQASQLLLAARGDKNEALYHLALATGARQSELLGLTWADLDWQKGTLNVQRQLRRNFKKGDYFSQPKTKNGRRTLALGPTTIAKLHQQWNRLADLRVSAGNLWQENNLIFPSSIGTPKNQANLFREFKQLIKDAGLPEIRFHDLRHSAASFLLNHGIAPIVVSRRLGHYQMSMTTDIYGHLMPEMQDDAAKLIDELITPVDVELHQNCTTEKTSPNEGESLPPYIEKSPHK